ncbi:MAG: ligase-associated DNA damage response exonuclease [Acidobacteriia bacterium]|nr:ligase-associated DNA damage response exonuclease [Terriglobia bacterium]
MFQTSTPRKPLLVPTPSGLYCEPGDFYIDPRRSVSKALITHAHSDHARAGSKAYLCALPCVSLLRHRLGTRACISGIPYGEKTTIGDVSVSFHSAGHILGSAQIRMEANGEVWVFSGDYKRAEDPTCPQFEAIHCDTFITESTFGLPIYRWDSGARIAGEILDWWNGCREAGRAAILYSYSLGKAERILAELAQITDRDVFVHETIQSVVACYREAGIRMLPTLPIPEERSDQLFSGQLILVPPNAGTSPWMERVAEYETAFASGWMMTRSSRRLCGFDRGFILSDHADWPALIQTAQESGADRVLVTHGNCKLMVQYLREQGIDASPLEIATPGPLNH